MTPVHHHKYLFALVPWQGRCRCLSEAVTQGEQSQCARGSALGTVLNYALQVLEIKAPSSCYFFPDIINEQEGWWVVSRMSDMTSHTYCPTTAPLGYGHVEEQNSRTK